MELPTTKRTKRRMSRGFRMKKRTKRRRMSRGFRMKKRTKRKRMNRVDASQRPRVSWLHVDSCADGTPIRLAIYEYGNPNGYPVIYSHGGPGANYAGHIQRLYDLDKYHFIAFDQRGCGNSTPRLLVEKGKNTTQRTIEDMETVREKIARRDQWLVAGGSWGAALSVLYAQEHPQRTAGLILRGFTDLRTDDLKRPMFNSVFTDMTDENFRLIGLDYKKHTEMVAVKKLYKRYMSYVPPLSSSRSSRSSSRRYDKQHACQKILGALTKGDRRLLSMFSDNQIYTIRKLKGKEKEKRGKTPHKREKRQNTCRASAYRHEHPIFQTFADALITYHYAKHNYFINLNQIGHPANVKKIANIPTFFVQGRYDIVCPFVMAYEMHKRMKNSQLLVAHGGHTTQNLEIQEHIRAAAKQFARMHRL